MRVLFVDIDFHLKTKSADFFLDILRTAFDVETHYYRDLYRASIPREKIDRADVVIVWQSTLGRADFVVTGKPCIYVPMYDCDWGSRVQWKRIGSSGTHVISFCDAITTRARRGGVPSGHLLDVRFAYDPAAFSGFEGDPEVAAIWERGFFGLDEFKQMFPPHFFKKLIVIRRPQPGLTFKPVSQADIAAYNITLVESEFIPKNDYLQLIKEPGVFLAPRPKEGIGMSFLEALAMGKCVIAHDDASMNEYITDGENGFIRNLQAPKIAPITREEIAAVRNHVKSAMSAQYGRWISDREKIIPFVRSATAHPPVRVGGGLDFLRRGLYVLEALKNRIN